MGTYRKYTNRFCLYTVLRGKVNPEKELLIYSLINESARLFMSHHDQRVKITINFMIEIRAMDTYSNAIPLGEYKDI